MRYRVCYGDDNELVCIERCSCSRLRDAPHVATYVDEGVMSGRWSADAGASCGGGGVWWMV